MFDLYRWSGVTIAAILTAIGAVAFSLALVILIYPPEAREITVRLTPIVTSLTALPISFFVWSKVRDNKILGRELQRLVNRDRLTDVATRDFFFATMQAAPEAYGTSLMIDIDHFKRVNDTFGHLAGDRIIRAVADVLRRNLRKEDIVCRFGGEEFVVFLFDLDVEAARSIAERMRREVEATVTRIDERAVPVTISIGGALKDRLVGLENAIREADAALYRAKSQGRNRLVFSADPAAVSAAPPDLSRSTYRLVSDEGFAKAASTS